MQAVLVEDLVLLQNVLYVLLEVLNDLDSEVRAGAGLHCPEMNGDEVMRTMLMMRMMRVLRAHLWTSPYVPCPISSSSSYLSWPPSGSE